jgi:hypothetical protein
MVLDERATWDMDGSVTFVPVNTMVPTRFRMVDGIDAAVETVCFFT